MLVGCYGSSLSLGTRVEVVCVREFRLHSPTTGIGSNWFGSSPVVIPCFPHSLV